uniref:FCH and double SH3 domains 2 n=1 Tax=Electrophorus electricus TaxID=8005 RepID=A0A4W4HL80_ELEEL
IPPPPVKVTQELKTTHTEQLTRLHLKHQTECDLLEDMRNVYGVWRAFLEGTVQVTQSRLFVCDNYKNEISDPAKTVRLYKEQQLKKCIEQLGRIQAELQDSVKDLAKSKKKYFEMEQMAQAVREKADIEAKSKLGLFQSRISLQKASVKLKAKRSDCNSKATHARNEYLLMLAAASAHQDRYYQTDLANCIKALDGNVYDHVKDYLMSFCRTELEACQAVHNTFQFLLEKSSRVVQDFNQQLFLQENPVFHKAQDFQFQPCDGDMTLSSVQQLVDIEPSAVSVMRMTLAQSRQLESETGTTEEHSLNKEARKWATRVAREHKNIIHYRRVLEECERQGTPPTEQSRNDLEFKMEEAKENIRKAETVKLKAEARLDLLRQVGVSVDTWLKSAMNQVMEELENERWASLPTLTTHDPSLTAPVDLDRDEGEDPEENMEAFDDSSSSPSGTLRNYPLTCKVLYSYKASQPDELTIDEHEMLEVIEDGDMEDWVKARNKAGHVGYVPEKYLQFPASNSLLSMLQSLAALDTRSHTSSNSTEPELASGSINGDASMSFVKAIYDYEGQTDEELSFPEGAVIRILNKDNQEDDGFWEGEFNGRVGVFPSVLVEDLTTENGDSHWTLDTQVSSCARLQSTLPPLPLYEQPTYSTYASPDSAPGPALPRSPSVNGDHKLPGSQKPPPDCIFLRQVRAAPPPPKQHPRRQVEKTEEVEITLV